MYKNAPVYYFFLLVWNMIEYILRWVRLHVLDIHMYILNLYASSPQSANDSDSDEAIVITRSTEHWHR